MTYTRINDHLISIPADMQTGKASPAAPGGYDFIAYKGREICTVETAPDTETAHKALALVEALATIVTPEEEFAAANRDEAGRALIEGQPYESVEEFVADLSDNYLGEKHAELMNAVREAQAILAYTGPFTITTGEGEGIEARDLDHVRALIDRGTDKEIGKSAHGFWAWFDKVVADAEASEDGKAFKAAGLTITHTGGGFVAWDMMVKAPHSGDYQILLTDDDGTALFDRPEWYVGASSDGGEVQWSANDGKGMSREAAIAAAHAMRDALLAEKLIHPAEVFSYNWPDGDPRHLKVGRTIPNEVFLESKQRGVGATGCAWAGAPGSGRAVYIVTHIDDSAGAYGIEVENTISAE